MRTITGWVYRESITINHTDDANYQMPRTLVKGTGRRLLAWIELALVRFFYWMLKPYSDYLPEEDKWQKPQK